MFLSSALAVLFLHPGVPRGERPAPELFRLAAALAADDLGGPRAAALDELETIERAAVAALRSGGGGGWNGPPAELALIHGLTAEIRLGRTLPPALLGRLRRDRERCHDAEPIPATADGLTVDELRAAVAERFPRLGGRLGACPAVAATLAAALSLPNRPVRLVDEEPRLAPGEVQQIDGQTVLRLSADFAKPENAPAALPALLFEAFNAHNSEATGLLADRASRGELARHEYVRATVALEQLALANLQRVYLEHLPALRSAGVSVSPDWWWVGSARVFLPSDARWTVETAGYPYSVYGVEYDEWQALRAVKAYDLWEAAVVLDRLRLSGGGGSRGELVSVLERVVRDSERASLAVVLLRRCPDRVRFGLATTRGFDRLADRVGTVPGWLSRLPRMSRLPRILR